MFSVDTILSLITKVGPLVRALPEFKETFDSIVSTFKESDQTVLRSKYETLQAENDAGFQRLDDKLETAKNL